MIAFPLPIVDKMVLYPAGGLVLDVFVIPLVVDVGYDFDLCGCI